MLYACGGISFLIGVLYAGYVALQGWTIHQDHFLASNQVAPLPVPTITPTSTPSSTPTPSPTSTPLPTWTPSPTLPPSPTPTLTPPPLPEPVQISIPAIGVQSPVILVPLITNPVTGIAEWDVNRLFRPDRKDVVGYLEGTSLPGQTGNAVLSGHNYGYGYDGVFVNLGQLKAGDRVTIINTAGAELVYEVTSLEHVPWQRKTLDEMARHLEYLSPDGEERLTLMSCGGIVWPFLERIYVVAKPVR